MRRRLSQVDAFFVAYQEAAGVSMQLGAEIELVGPVNEDSVVAGLDVLVRTWPRLGQCLRPAMMGLCWDGPPRPSAMLTRSDNLAAWRNRLIDPFREPPFQLLWLQDGSRHTLAFRAHHSVIDGQGMMSLCHRAAIVMSGGPEPEVGDRSHDPFSPRAILKRGHLPTLLRHAGKTVSDSLRNTSARLTIDSDDRGDIDVVDREVAGPQRQRILERARSLGVSPAILVGSAWIRAIGAHNRNHGGTQCERVSLEMPLSTRRRRGGPTEVGNMISPLVVFGIATDSLEQTAAALKRQLLRGVRERAHLAMPLFTAPSKYMPWPVFRRLAANTLFSGFATSHYAWLDSHGDTHAQVRAVSNGAIEMVGLTVYSPVCLHMGAALTAMPWDEFLQFSLTHRVTALSREVAKELLSTVIDELEAAP